VSILDMQHVSKRK